MPALDSLPVTFLFRIEASVSDPVRLDSGPRGARLILAATGGHFEGPELKGAVVPGPGSEWATLRPDGSLEADVRLLLRTEDGAHILMTYHGIGLVDEQGLRITTAPLFQTDDQRYAWLNRVQAVGIGAPVDGGVGYDVYRVN